jgi:hypothetical protein
VFEDHLLNPRQTASILGCTEATLAVWRRRSTGPGWVRVGRLIRYRHSNLIRWIEAKTVDPEPCLDISAVQNGPNQTESVKRRRATIWG